MMQPLIDQAITMIETTNDPEQLKIMIQLNKTWRESGCRERINYGLVIEKSVQRFAWSVEYRSKLEKVKKM